jgi:predicted DNA-binding transcriptional regulator AlpA
MRHNATSNNLTGVDVLDDKQVSALLNTNPRTLRLWRHTRGLPFVRITSKVIRYRRADIDEWLARRRVAIGI